MSIPTTQKALLSNRKGDRLALTTRPVPSPGPDQVLIKVGGAGLNPHDRDIRDDGIIVEVWPWVPANDLGGKVVKLGDGVTKYAVGDEIFGQTDFYSMIDHSGAQEYALMNVKASAKVPSGKSLDDALTLPTNLIAAFWAIHDDSGLHLPLPGSNWKGKGQFDFSKHDLLVLGGGSQLGKLTVQVAKLDGWRNIVVNAGLRNEAELKNLGATHVIDRRLPQDDQVKQIRKIVGDNLLHTVDTVTDDLTLAVAALSNSEKGTIVQVREATVDESKIGNKKAGYNKEFVFGVSTKPSSLPLAQEVWAKIPEWVETGVFKIPEWVIIDGLDADKVNDALDNWRDEKPVPRHVHIRV